MFTAGGRFETLNSNRANNTVSRTFTYGYLANSQLLSSLSVAGGHPFTVNRTYETARDVLTAIDAKWSTTSVTRYDYTANALYQRDTAKQSGSAFADYGDATYRRYTYNPRGELTGAPAYLGANVALTTQPLPGRQDGFAYDSLGNRQWADRTGDAAQREDYTTNALNQVTTKENLTAPVQGTVDAAATKTAVAGAATTGRQGRYFGAEAAVANDTAPWAGALQVYAAKIGGGTAGADLIRTEVRTAQLAKALQTFTYDLDGNLTSDGLWDYQWDAENRLIRQATTSLAAGAGFPNRVLEFRYDHIGRRVQKRVLDGATLLTERRFIYSGWDVIAEVDQNNILKRSFTWGLDLVGSLSASGSVGALLQITDHQSSISYLPTYDGNGNVASLLNADTGALEAAYEYDPFGQLLRAEGAYAKENPFRFSTKFQDEETGLIYYGYRYYSASMGRFVNRDPIEEAGGLNLYAFAGNDGINGIDYLGLDGDGCPSAADGGGGIFFPRLNFGLLSFVIRDRGGPVKPKPPQAAPPSSLDRERLEDRGLSPTDARNALDDPSNQFLSQLREAFSLRNPLNPVVIANNVLIKTLISLNELVNIYNAIVDEVVAALGGSPADADIIKFFGPLAASEVIAALRGLNLAAKTTVVAAESAVTRGAKQLVAPPGRKLAQQIARFRAAGGKGGRVEFLEHANALAERARKVGDVVTGTVGRGPQAIPNATIFREGSTFIVVDEAGVIRSFVPNASPGGIVDEFIRLGGRL